MESAIRSAFVGIGVNGIQGSVMRALGINERMDILAMILYCYEIAGITDWILERRSHGKDSR